MGKSLADRIPNPGINTHLPRINKTSMQTRRGFQERRGSVPECASPLALSVRTRVAGPHDGIRWHLVPGRKRQRTAALQDRSESISAAKIDSPRLEPIPNPRLGEKQHGLIRMPLQFLAKTGHVNPQVMRL